MRPFRKLSTPVVVEPGDEESQALFFLRFGGMSTEAMFRQGVSLRTLLDLEIEGVAESAVGIDGVTYWRMAPKVTA